MCYKKVGDTTLLHLIITIITLKAVKKKSSKKKPIVM